MPFFEGNRTLRDLWPWVSAFVIGLLPGIADARLLQIIHTNDLHSHFEKGSKPGAGGYAALKYRIDSLKAEAEAQGIDTLVLDGGDLSEGSQFFLADQGEQSWRMMDSLGYDAVVIGNHDYLMGQVDLDRILRNVEPRYPVLAANFDVAPGLPALKRHMAPYTEVRKAGAKIAILGLTTDEFVFTWRVGSKSIVTPKSAAKHYAPRLKARNDFVIALTHIGVSADRSVIRSVPGIDLVVGGHSHTFLHNYLTEKNPDGLTVPIVQAGKHGEVVGDLLVDIEPGKPLQILRYRLIPVMTDGPRDTEVEQHVAEARSRLEAQYGYEWLHEPIGHSLVPIEEPSEGPTIWGRVVADAMREAVKAEASLDAAALLFGDNQPPGPVTREGLILFYPRVFTFDTPFGWTVWSVDVPGWALKLVLQEGIRRGIYWNVSNMTFDVVGEHKKQKIRNLKIDGRKVSAAKCYRIAVPEGIGRGVDEIIQVIKLVLRNPTDSGIPIWTAIEAKVREVGVIGPDYPKRPPSPMWLPVSMPGFITHP